MLNKIVLFFVFSSALLTAQYSAIHGNLIRIPFDAVQINPADTMGSWVDSYSIDLSVHSGYTGTVHSPQHIYFMKYLMQDYATLGLTTQLYLEDFDNQTSDSYGWWMGYYDVPEPYIIYGTIPFRIDNGSWLMDGVYNMAFVSDDDNITILPHEYPGGMTYISGKINDKYLTVFRTENSPYSYNFYLLDLSDSPYFDTTNAERIYFDSPVAPYKLIHLENSLYIAGVDSLPDGYSGIVLYNLENNTFHFIKSFFYTPDEYWYYRNGSLFLEHYLSLSKYEYNPADTSFINETVIVSGGGINVNRDFSITAQLGGNILLIYNNNTAQLINTIDLSGLQDPGASGIIIDSPYVYLSQVTGMTDVKDKPVKPLSYDLQIYPNPFNPSANIEYTIPERAVVHIRLFDVLGREVREIFGGESAAGTHQIKINGKDLSAGVYLVNFASEKYNVTKKVVLLK